MRPARLARLTLLSPLVALLALGCDDPKSGSASGSGATTSSASQAVSAKPEPPKSKGMPNLLVDAEGPYIGAERVKMTDPNAAEKLTKLVKDLPIEGKPVTLIV